MPDKTLDKSRQPKYLMSNQPSSETKSAILQVLAIFPEIKIASIFGSAVHGRLTTKSDIDIAVAASAPLFFDRQHNLGLSLSKELEREVDVVDLQAVSGPILQQALCNGVIIKKSSALLLAALIKKMWYNQEDMMPNYRMILQERCRRFING